MTKTESSATEASTPQASASQASALEVPAKLDIEAVSAQLIVLDANGPRTYDHPDELQVGPPTLFAVAPVVPTDKRYLYLLQKETKPETGYIVLLLVVDTREGAGTRVPPAGAWQRAIIKGTVHLIASNLELTRDQIVAFMGGHEPPPTTAQPPFT